MTVGMEAYPDLVPSSRAESTILQRLVERAYRTPQETDTQEFFVNSRHDFRDFRNFHATSPLVFCSYTFPHPCFPIVVGTEALETRRICESRWGAATKREVGVTAPGWWLVWGRRNPKSEARLLQHLE